MAKVTLGEVLETLEKLGEDLAVDKPMIDLKGLIPMNDHHQTAVFLRLPSKEAMQDSGVQERVVKFLTSINRPDTIKADVYTLLGGNCRKGYQPTIAFPVVDGKPCKEGLFNPDWIVAQSVGYVLQITVDIVKPDVLAMAVGKPFDASLPDWAQKKVDEHDKNKPLLVEGHTPHELIEGSLEDDDESDDDDY